MPSEGAQQVESLLMTGAHSPCAPRPARGWREGGRPKHPAGPATKPSHSTSWMAGSSKMAGPAHQHHQLDGAHCIQLLTQGAPIAPSVATFLAFLDPRLPRTLPLSLRHALPLHSPALPGPQGRTPMQPLQGRALPATPRSITCAPHGKDPAGAQHSGSSGRCARQHSPGLAPASIFLRIALVEECLRGRTLRYQGRGHVTGLDRQRGTVASSGPRRSFQLPGRPQSARAR